jgi:hypothetical protein
VGKGRRQRRFDLRLRHPRSQHGQRVTQIHHTVQAGAEEVVSGYRFSSQNSQKPTSIEYLFGSSGNRESL